MSPPEDSPAPPAAAERIFVSVRLRPMNAKELERGDSCDWDCVDNTTVVFRGRAEAVGAGDRTTFFPTAYAYDRVFGLKSTTLQVYEEGAKEVVLSVLQGINSSIFAYGQTSSGKTYTMTGITEYGVSDIYDHIQKHNERQYVLKFSAMEIYNEAVRDLLGLDPTPLRLLDDPEKGTVVEKLTEETLRDQDHFRELLAICEAQRHIGETSLNEMSSRSHQILRLSIESSSRDIFSRDSSGTFVASVNFVDLAGSERASQALSAGVRLKEGCHINRSLLTLGTVIRKLSKGRTGHIPYRDSKLTRILQSSLGGNARTAIICTMSPAHSHIEQSRNTLLFATCAKEVVTNAQVNVVMSDKALIKHLQRELARLENELTGSASCSTHIEALRQKDAQIMKLEKEKNELMQQRDLVRAQLENLQKRIGDEHSDDGLSSKWDHCGRSSSSHARNESTEALSAFEAYDINCHDRDFHLVSLDPVSVTLNGHFQNLPEITREQQYTFGMGLQNNPMFGVDAGHSHTDVEGEYKEVQCIEINELGRYSGDSSCLSIEGLDSLPSLVDSAKSEAPELQSYVTAEKLESPRQLLQAEDLIENGDQEIQSVTATSNISQEPKTINDSLVPTLYKSSLTFDSSKPWPHKSFAMMKDTLHPRVTAASRSRSCRAILISESGDWSDILGSEDMTPPDHLPEDSRRNPERVIRNLSTQSSAFVSERNSLKTGKPMEYLSSQPNVYLGDRSSVEGSLASEYPTANDVIEIACDSSNDNNCVVTDISCVTSHTEEPKDEQHKQQSNQHNNNSKGERIVEDSGVDPIMNSIGSPSQLPVEFEKKQHEILELWHLCNVSIVHRTYFFLLFKGDLSDSIYLEVELRRLSFLKTSLSKPAAECDIVPSSLKNLRREREMMYKLMLKLLPMEERESLYRRWEIALNTKQRRMQLSRKIWTETNLEHVRESASLVARLIGFQEPGHSLKEMFGLSLTLSPRADRKSFSWIQG